MRSALLSSAAFALAVVVADGGVARAGPNEVEQCASASEHAQLLRLKGRLVEARSELQTCGRRTCPAVVRKDCDRWLGEVEAELPSIVIAAHDERGTDLGDVQVSVDGKTIVDRLDGRAIAVDPGPHEVRIESNGKAVQRSIIVREGEKRRSVDVTFASAAARVDPTTPAAAPSDSASTGSGSTIVGWSLVALGVAGAGVGTYLGLRQASAYDEAGSCSPGCPQSTKDEIDSLRLYEGIAFAAAGAALITGVIILLTRPSTRAARLTTRIDRVGIAF